MLIVIQGPTASGKTKFAVELAKKLKTEIISADSIQIYKQLIIGAATPTNEQMEGIKHHLIGNLDLLATTTAGRFSETASEIVKEVISKFGTAVMVGGTNFYVTAFLKGLSPTPTISVETKENISQLKRDKSTDELFEMLTSIDPLWANAISSPNDEQRILRGLEVFLSTGKTLSDWNKMPRTGVYKNKYIKLGMLWDREKLYSRINQRSKNMVESGLIPEVEKILKEGYTKESSPPLNSIGYKETIDFLAGDITREQLINKIAQNTRHLAKRQLTWLRNDSEINWINPQNYKIDEILNIIND